MNINDVSAILKLDKSLREDVRKAERQRDEIDSHIAESVKELRDSRYAKLNSELEAYEKNKTAETDRRISDQADQYKKQIDAIDAKYNAEKDNWLKHIVGAVTEV